MSDEREMVGPPPEFFGNVVAQLREHWVDRQAVREGVDPMTVTRALIAGNTVDAEVRIGAAARAAVYLDDDRIVSLDELATMGADRDKIWGLVPDVAPNAPFMFFDLDLGYLKLDLDPLREWAKRHLEVAEQFRFAAEVLVERGGFEGACENLFAAAELATMALMEAGDQSVFGHSRRSAWLEANGPTFGLSATESEVLTVLFDARNVYRYGDRSFAISAVDLIERRTDVDHLIGAARAVVGDDPR